MADLVAKKANTEESWPFLIKSLRNRVVAVIRNTKI